MFILKQVFFLAVAGAIVVGVSLLSPRDVRRLALVGCVVALALTAMTLVVGVEIKGARRWIALPGMAIQPQRIPETLLRRRRRLADRRGQAVAALPRHVDRLRDLRA